MPVPSDKVTISIVIEKEIKEILEQHAAELDMSVSRFARNCIYVALDDYKILKRIGLVRVALGFRSLMETIKNHTTSHATEEKA